MNNFYRGEMLLFYHFKRFANFRSLEKWDHFICFKPLASGVKGNIPIVTIFEVKKKSDVKLIQTKFD